MISRKKKSSKKKLGMGLSLAVLLLLGLGCGGEENSRINVSLYGWSDDADDFVSGLPDYPGAHQVRVKVTRPESREIITERNFPFAERRADLPEVPAGGGLRMDFEVRDIGGSILAAGNTPLFDAEETGQNRSFRTLVSRTNQFAPVGQLVRIQDSNEQRLVQTRFDGRELEVPLGRVGHRGAVTSDGQFLVVGGGEVGAFHLPSTLPDLQRTLGDIQLFDPATGYFTELAGDSRARSAGQIGADRLPTPRAFPTLTALGNDRFLVVGGFEVVGNSVQPSRAIDLIDLNAEPGSRVRQLLDLSGSPIRLQDARGLHTATLRAADGRVVIAGGIGSDTSTVRSTFEVINPQLQGATVEGGLTLQSPRVGHSALLMEDGRTVWLLGGRSETGALATTEVLVLGDTGTISESAATMSRARFGASVHPLGPGGNNFIAVFGGFTGLTGGATATIELGRPDGAFQSDSSWRMGRARGEGQLFELPQSREILIVGGLNPDFTVVPNVERIRFLGVASAEPFFVDEPQGSMYQRRGGFAAALVSNGRIVLTGGQDRGEGARNDAEYFNPRDPVIPPRR